MSRSRRLASLIILAILSGASAQTFGATIEVAPGVTEIAADGECSLTEAINNANANTQVDNDDCPAGSLGVNTLILAPGAVYVLDAALPALSSLTVIEGNGAVLERNDALDCVLDGTQDTGEFRILTQSGGFLQINDLVIRNGCADGTSTEANDGGGIRVDDGDLKLVNVTLEDNVALDKSGALDTTNATVHIIDSLLRNNSAGGGGGAIGNDTTATMLIIGTTISDNTALGLGGGGIGNRGTMRVVNSTIAGNASTPTETGGGGGGIGNVGDLTLVNVTIADNFDDGGGMVGGGGIANAGSVVIRNSVVANSPDGGDCVSVAGSFSTIDQNIDTDGSCSGFTTHTPAILALEPLADNGGPTPTMRPGPASPAVNAIAVCLDSGVMVSADQRSVPRNQGAGCDLGALERVRATLAVEVTGQGQVDAAALPAPEIGGIDACDAASLGQSRCEAVYSEDGNEDISLELLAESGWQIDSASGCDGELTGSSFAIARLTADCTVLATFVEMIDGQCGAADGGAFPQAPSEDLCAAGQPGEVLGDGPWFWTCQGIDGGANASCSADYQPPEDSIFQDRFE